MWRICLLSLAAMVWATWAGCGSSQPPPQSAEQERAAKKQAQQAQDDERSHRGQPGPAPGKSTP